MGSDNDTNEKKQEINNFNHQSPQPNANSENYKHQQNVPAQQLNYGSSNQESTNSPTNQMNHSEDKYSSENENLPNQSKDGNNFEKTDYISKYNENELMNMLKNYIENFNILDSIYGKKEGSQDPVFDAINESQKNILTDYFRKNKNEFVRLLLNFLSSRSLNVAQKIITDLIQTEDGSSVYEKKVIREIGKINENKELFKINYLTILVVGKTGVGKSTLINCILKLEGNERAPENEKDTETMIIKDYRSAKVPYLRLVDTRGLELGNYDANALGNDCLRYSNEQRNTKDMNKFIHCIWYCVTGARLEKVERQAIEILKNLYNKSNIPIIIVYTQSQNLKLIEARKKNVQDNSLANDYISVLAREVELPNGSFLPSSGLSELLAKTINVCKKALNGDLHSVMTNNIGEYIYNNLKIENSKINKCIKEKNILNFIQKYNNNIKNKDEFQNYIVKIYGRNINYFLNKELGFNGVNVIKGSYLVSIHNNNYINYYQDIINQIVSKELQNLSIKGLITQASIEKKRGMATLNQNKRDLDDFSKYNTKFLFDNFTILAQKYYIEFILQKSCIEFSIIFEQQLNNLIVQILGHPNIGNKINNLFQQRFKEFEEKIINKSLAFNTPESKGIPNYQNNTGMNGRDDYTESNGKIVMDFNNNDIKSIRTENYSNLNSNLANINQNLKKNNQPVFNQGMSSNKSKKDLSDIKTTKTIMIDPNYHNQHQYNRLNSGKNVRYYNNIYAKNQVFNNTQNANKTISYSNGVYNQGYNYRS